MTACDRRICKDSSASTTIDTGFSARRTHRRPTHLSGGPFIISVVVNAKCVALQQERADINVLFRYDGVHINRL